MTCLGLHYTIFDTGGEDADRLTLTKEPVSLCETGSFHEYGCFFCFDLIRFFLILRFSVFFILSVEADALFLDMINQFQQFF